MEFIQITARHILIYAETEKRELEIKKLVEKFLQAIKALQAELK